MWRLGYIAAAIIIVLLLIMPAKTEAFDFFKSNPCDYTASDKTKSSICQQGSGQTKDSNPVINIIQIASSLIALIGGILAVLMIILSGFTLITSAGSQEAVTNSRKRITSAIIGLIIIALAWTIVRLVTDKIIQ